MPCELGLLGDPFVVRRSLKNNQRKSGARCEKICKFKYLWQKPGERQSNGRHSNACDTQLGTPEQSYCASLLCCPHPLAAYSKDPAVVRRPGDLESWCGNARDAQRDAGQAPSKARIMERLRE
jgi:hypothetical protein